MRVAVVLAGGSGTRSGAPTNKALIELAGITVLRRSVDAMIAGGADAVVVVTRPDDRAAVAEEVGELGCTVVDGGPTRQRSEAAGVEAAAGLGATGYDDVIAVHDAARPLVGPELVAAVFDAAAGGAAYPGVEVSDVWHVDGDPPVADRPVAGGLVAAQTPQAARADLLVAAHRTAADGPGDATDTIEVVTRHRPGRVEVEVVPGDPDNLKLTWPGDFAAAEALVAVVAPPPGDGSALGAAPVESPAVDTIAAESPAEPDSDSNPEGAVDPLDELERAVGDAQIALDCLARAGTDICGTCGAAEADGSLDQRPALARCVAAKRG